MIILLTKQSKGHFPNNREQGYRDVDVLLKTFRADPSVQEEMDRQFAWLDKLTPPSEAEIQEKVFLEYLEKWKPDGDPN